MRRSKKIGLTQGGRVKDGRPREKWSHAFSQWTWEQLSTQSLPRWNVIRENPSRDYFHPCMAAEIHGVLARLPAHLADGVRAIVLRRLPKLDKRLGIEAQLRYSCIILNSFPKTREMWWPSHPLDVTFRHYRCWSEDWSQHGRRWCLTWSDSALKRYYLYHLLLHEVGHLNQPLFHAAKRREEYAENFALEWARKLDEH